MTRLDEIQDAVEHVHDEFRSCHLDDLRWLCRRLRKAECIVEIARRIGALLEPVYYAPIERELELLEETLDAYDKGQS